MTTYHCDGMPSMRGCGNEITTTRPYTKEGLKKSGWLVTHATEDLEGTPSLPIHLMFFCPSCSPSVLEQERKEQERKAGGP